jgi:hypothetical protein
MLVKDLILKLQYLPQDIPVVVDFDPSEQTELSEADTCEEREADYFGTGNHGPEQHGKVAYIGL